MGVKEKGLNGVPRQHGGQEKKVTGGCEKPAVPRRCRIETAGTADLGPFRIFPEGQMKVAFP